MYDNLKERLTDMSVLASTRTPADALQYIEDLEAKLAKAVEIGNRMAASIEGNYYIPGVAGEWRKLTGGKDE